MEEILLKDIRLNIGLKSYKVAEYLGVSKRHFIRIENGQINDIEKYKYKLADIYNVPIDLIEKSWEEVKNE